MRKLVTEWRQCEQKSKFELVHKATGDILAMAYSGGVRGVTLKINRPPWFSFERENRLQCQRLVENNIKNWFPEKV